MRRSHLMAALAAASLSTSGVALAQSQRAKLEADQKFCGTNIYSVDLNAGVDACSRVLAARGQKPEVRAAALHGRGMRFVELKRYADAVRDFDEMIKLFPRLGPAYLYRGYTKFQMKDKAAALADLGKAIDLDRFNPVSHSQRGFVHTEMENYAEARRDYQEALRLDQRHPASLYFFALLEYRVGDYEAALQLLDRAQQSGYARGSIGVTRSLALYRLGRFGPAEAEATAGIAANPSELALFEARARIKLARGEPRDALADIEQAVRLNDAHARSFSTRAAIRLALKDLDGALSDAERAIFLEPDLLDARLTLGDIYDAKRDDDAARKAWQGLLSARVPAAGYDKATHQAALDRLKDLGKPRARDLETESRERLTTRCATKTSDLRSEACDRLIATAASDAELAAAHLLRADLGAERREHAAELSDLNATLKLRPQNVAALRRRGALHLVLHVTTGAALDPARADADAAVAHASADSLDRAMALLLRVSISRRAQRLDAALSDLDALDAVQHHLTPDERVIAHQYRAEAQMALGRYAGARDDAMKGVALLGGVDKLRANGDDSGDAVEFARLLLASNATREAVEIADALLAAPGRFRALAALEVKAIAQVRAGDAGQARASFDQVSRGTNGSFTSNLGRAYYGVALARTGDARAAMTTLDGVLSAGPAALDAKDAVQLSPLIRAELHRERALARAALGRLNEGLADLDAAIAMEPDNALNHGLRADLALRAQNRSAALASIDKALSLTPGERRWLALAARARLASGDAAGAINALDRALPSAPADMELRLLRARARAAMNDHRGAAEDASEILSRDSNQQAALELRMEALRAQGDMAGAVKDGEALMQRAASDAALAIRIADLKTAAGDHIGAINLLELAAKPLETRLAAQLRLGEAYAALKQDQVALTYFLHAIEGLAVSDEDRATQDKARAARDALLRRAAGK